ncbi:5-formyltetrahydrofolate cyclo-ligase [Rufibacter sediminis]|uniref:5-formyltetrahydrofolate cyclo-ligase n=1 Tax=Rufibacter sediminis TaxID=2762756 RepID=A0ABR6VV66_9BACT|nr:5-formyltetrahydrofolate cyclo-ligase [Rufibacter sediminis]MBC3541075.1 5-formyltetrahydrofolate cyclo-ligase [Rufibacter sediminis]
MALKANLRKEYSVRRRLFSAEQIDMASDRIADRFFAEYAPQPGQTVHTFLPIRQHQEINTWRLVERLWQLQVQVAVPVANPADLSMTHFLISPDTQFREAAWGIPEPVNALPIPESAIDLVLVPLLAFDLQGHRVGYGKGFYDRFLALLPKVSQKLGLSLEPPVDLIDDVHVNDLALDAVITPEQIWTFHPHDTDAPGGESR